MSLKDLNSQYPKRTLVNKLPYSGPRQFLILIRHLLTEGRKVGHDISLEKIFKIIYFFFSTLGIFKYTKTNKAFYIMGLGKFKPTRELYNETRKLKRKRLLNRRAKILVRVHRYNAKKLSQSLNNNL